MTSVKWANKLFDIIGTLHSDVCYSTRLVDRLILLVPVVNEFLRKQVPQKSVENKSTH